VEKKLRMKAASIVLLMTIIGFLHYSTEITAYRYHIFYQELYFLVVILGGFWIIPVQPYRSP
jgi:hypothetical protein